MEQEMIDKLKNHKNNIDDLTNKYQLVVQNKRIPDIQEATTFNNLKKLICNERTCVKDTNHITTQMHIKTKYIPNFSIVDFSSFQVSFF